MTNRTSSALGWILAAVLGGSTVLALFAGAVWELKRWNDCQAASAAPGDAATEYHPLGGTCTAHVWGSDVRVF